MNHRDDEFRNAAVKKIVSGDLFSWRNPVITIKTKGRTYGALSRHADSLGVPLPDLVLGCAAFLDPYIFVALWDDESPYTPQLFASCAATILHTASRNGIPLVAIPLLGGKKEAMSQLGIVEEALVLAADDLDDRECPVPDWIYVTSGSVDSD